MNQGEEISLASNAAAAQKTAARSPRRIDQRGWRKRHQRMATIRSAAAKAMAPNCASLPAITLSRTPQSSTRRPRSAGTSGLPRASIFMTWAMSSPKAKGARRSTATDRRLVSERTRSSGTLSATTVPTSDRGKRRPMLSRKPPVSRTRTRVTSRSATQIAATATVPRTRANPLPTRPSAPRDRRHARRVNEVSVASKGVVANWAVAAAAATATGVAIATASAGEASFSAAAVSKGAASASTGAAAASSPRF